MMLNRCLIGDCRVAMRQLIAAGVRVQCVVTSPPYWGLRDYDCEGQFGLERTWERHVARMRSVFRLVRELLADDGVLWLNYGDSYYSPRAVGGIGFNSQINGQRSQEEFRKASRAMKSRIRPPDVDGPNRRRQRGLKPKDLIGMPWRIAFALQEDGWFLRSDVVWHKPNPMPESVTDRPTKAHEYLFLLAKSERYYYDGDAIREPVSGNAHAHGDGVNPKARKHPAGWGEGPGISHSTLKHARSSKDAARHDSGLKDSTKFGRGAGWRNKQNESFSAAIAGLVNSRNARTVWTIAPEAFNAAHFATFPRILVRRCVLAGSKPGDIVFDPFMGSGTVAQVADELGRNWLGCELNPAYASMYGKERVAQLGIPL